MSAAADIPDREQNYWYNSAPDGPVTLQHGTSEGQLATILKNGFKPINTSLENQVRDVLNDYLPPEQINDGLVKEVLSHSRHSGMRNNQTAAGRTIFACPAPSKSAEGYAATNAEHGGEFANDIHSIMVHNLGYKDLPPRFEGARPVLVEFDAPRGATNGFVPDASHREHYARLDRNGTAIGGQEIGITDPSQVNIKSVTFANRNEKGEWSFDGQPALTREQALAEINPEFRAPAAIPEFRFAAAFSAKPSPAAPKNDLQPAVQKTAFPQARSEKLGENISDIEKWTGKKFDDAKSSVNTLAAVSLEAQRFIDGQISPAKMGDAVSDFASNLNLLVLHDPKMAAGLCASVLANPKLGELKDVTQAAATTAWKEMLKNDPEGTKDYARIQLHVYGDKPEVAGVIKGFPALSGLPPLMQADAPATEKKSAPAPRRQSASLS